MLLAQLCKPKICSGFHTAPPGPSPQRASCMASCGGLQTGRIWIPFKTTKQWYIRVRNILQERERGQRGGTRLHRCTECYMGLRGSGGSTATYRLQCRSAFHYNLELWVWPPAHKSPSASSYHETCWIEACCPAPGRGGEGAPRDRAIGLHERSLKSAGREIQYLSQHCLLSSPINLLHASKDF